MSRRPRGQTVADEFSPADLGDKRLDNRLLAIAGAVASAPSSSFPELTGSDGELEGVYRFLSNARVWPQKILAPHFEATERRAHEAGDVLVVHDTTLFTFGGTSPRDGLGWVHKEGGEQGFFGHFALAVSGDGTRRPLGVAGLSTIVRKGKPLGRKFTGRDRWAREHKESARWAALALAVHANLPRAVHVMDREADSFDVFEALADAGASFVIRVRDAGNRVALHEGDRVPVSTLSLNLGVRLRRTVTLSRRRPSRLVARNKIHAPRSERIANLEVRSSTVAIPRPTNQGRLIQPRHRELNVVWVTEVGQPAGEEPVSWTLFTNKPASTEAELGNIIDAYRARWLIEEFFKALKTGCAFEKRQLETRHALMNALAIFSVVAWKLLLLRATARASPDSPADTAVTPRQVRLLKALARMRDPRIRRIQMPDNPTAQDALLAIASLGGHIKNNGPPGWQVLGRGYDSLLLMELGALAQSKM